MTLAAEPVAIEQPQAALLAGADEELPAAVVDDDRRRVDVEISPPQPVGIRRAEVVRELQLLVLVELHADDAAAIDQPQPAILAGAHDELPAAVVDDDRRRVDVEI